jgi:hypothetical protein
MQGMEAHEEDALLALLEMREYEGTEEQFLHESTSRIRTRLNCSGDAAMETLKELRDRKEVDFAITQGGKLAQDQDIPVAKWYWFIPQAIHGRQ